MTPLVTTLRRIEACQPCTTGWRKLLRGLGKTTADDEPLPFSAIVEINGLKDALWCCRAAPEYDRQWRLFAVWCARQVQHQLTDPRSLAAIDVAERYARGDATKHELDVARAAAYAAGDSVATAYTAYGRFAFAAAYTAYAVTTCAAYAAYVADAPLKIKHTEFLRAVNGGEQ